MLGRADRKALLTSIARVAYEPGFRFEEQVWYRFGDLDKPSRAVIVLTWPRREQRREDRDRSSSHVEGGG